MNIPFKRWLAVFGAAFALELVLVGLKSYAGVALPKGGADVALLSLSTAVLSYRLQGKSRPAWTHALIALLEGIVFSTVAILVFAGVVIFTMKRGGS